MSVINRGFFDEAVETAGQEVNYLADINEDTVEESQYEIGLEGTMMHLYEAEEAWKFEYLEVENKISEATNLVRGSYGPYLGITGYPTAGKLIDIRVPGFASTTESELFTMRYNDKSPYYAISDRIALKDIDDWFINYSLNDTNIEHMKLINPLYRGDCYIC